MTEFFFRAGEVAEMAGIYRLTLLRWIHRSGGSSTSIRAIATSITLQSPDPVAASAIAL